MRNAVTYSRRPPALAKMISIVLQACALMVVQTLQGNAETQPSSYSLVFIFGKKCDFLKLIAIFELKNTQTAYEEDFRETLPS